MTGLTADLRSHQGFPLRAWELSLYVIITIVGISGNTLVLLALKRNKEMRSCAFGVYLGSLAVADILVSALCLPVYITSTDIFTGHPKGLAGDIVCKLWTSYFVLFYFAVISVYTLVAISVERYLAICHPMKAKIKSTPERAKKIVFVIWMFAFVPNFALIAGLKSADYGDASFGAHCTAIKFNTDAVWKAFYVAVLTMQYIIPITCMIVCYIKIKRALHEDKIKAFTCETPHVQAGQLSAIRVRRKTIRTVIVMIVTYFSCWSLNQVLYFLLNLGFGMPWNGDFMQLSVILCFVSSCSNPVIYACRSKQFREEFAQILCCHWKKRACYAVVC